MLSPLVLGAIWINRHHMFEHIARVDAGFLLLNVLQLRFAVFLPFPTAVLVEARLTLLCYLLLNVFYLWPRRGQTPNSPKRAAGGSPRGAIRQRIGASRQ